MATKKGREIKVIVYKQEGKALVDLDTALAIKTVLEIEQAILEIAGNNEVKVQIHVMDSNVEEKK